MYRNVYKIAFCGVFDIANYGDQLFPIVFNEMMKLNNIKCELSLFSIFDGKQSFGNDSDVFALKDLEKMHIEKQYDAIIVGGGELVHFLRFKQKVGDKFERDLPYAISQTWIIPSMVAFKYDVKLIWNAPGVPFDFGVLTKKFVKTFSDSVDYISIRNSHSKKFLINAGIPEEKIGLFPDTAFKISKIYDKNKLECVKQQILPFDGKYVVFHINAFIKEEEIDTIIKCLDNLIDRGFTIVLLPLAYTHGDHEILAKLNNKVSNRYFEFNKILNIEEIISVLAFTSLYIGVSYHGAITSMAFGNKAIAYNFMKYKKTEDLFDELNISENHIYYGNELQACIDRVFEQKDNICMDDIDSRLSKHFIHIGDIITSDHIVNERRKLFINDMFETALEGQALESEIYKKENYINELVDSLNWHIEKVHDLNKAIEGFQQKDVYIKELEEKLNWHANKLQEMNQAFEGLKQKDIYIKNLEDSIGWHINKVRELDEGIKWHLEYEEELKRTQEYTKYQLSECRKHIFEIESTFSWKITKIFRKKQR